jgi:hypothetical protein
MLCDSSGVCVCLCLFVCCVTDRGLCVFFCVFCVKARGLCVFLCCVTAGGFLYVCVCVCVL